MRPALVEFGERVRQMERPVGRELDDGSDFFCFVVACNGHSPDRKLALDGVRLETKNALRTARTGGRSPLGPRYSPRRSRFATSPLPSPWNGERPPRRSL